MTWPELKTRYVNDHLSKDLKEPKIRLNALNRIEETLHSHFPEIISNPENLLNHDKNQFKEKVSKYKDNKRLNGAESSVINGLYKFLKLG